MPAQFRQFGLSFSYPENWTLDRDTSQLGERSVTVYSPGGGFWSVSVHTGSASPVKLAAAAVEAMKKEYEGLEVEEIHETLAGRELTGYDMNFFLFDFTNTAQVRSLRCNNSTYTFFYQAEDREFELINKVFMAMTVSLLNGLRDLNSKD